MSEYAVTVERCGEPIKGLYGADTTCVRQKGHAPGHRPTDGIWRELPDPRDPATGSDDAGEPS